MMIFLSGLSLQESDTIARIFSLYEKTMYYVAYSILRDHLDAEDAVINTVFNLVKLLGRLDSDLSGARNRAFICTVANFAAREILRNRTKEDQKYTREQTEKGYTEDFDFSGIYYRALKNQMYKINSEQAELLVLKYVFGLKNKEIARLAELSLSNIKIRIHRAKAAMKSDAAIRSFWGGGLK